MSGSFERAVFVRRMSLVLVATIVVGLTVSPSAAQSWERGLERGGALRVDPETRRAYRSDAGRSAPMWDGVHRLDDGSTVIIRDGIAVPTREMLDEWRGRSEPAPEEVEGPCAELVGRACGWNQECANRAACLRARQLMTAERSEQRLAPLSAGRRPETLASAACRAGLADAERFPPCGANQRVALGKACAALVRRVCGEDGRCEGSPACGPARQLLKMQAEAAEAYEGRGPLAEIEGQCAEALTNAFFAPCE